MKRPLALLVALLAVALVTSGCGSSAGPSTLNDAATITYTLKGEKHTLHVSQERLLAEVGYIVDNAPFAKFLADQEFNVKETENETVDSRITAIWLTQLIQQETIDSLFESRNLEVTPEIRAAAAKNAAAFFPGETIFPAFSRKFRATLTDRQARSEALLASYAKTTDAEGRAYFKEHQAEFSCASGRDVSHILVATQAEALAILDELEGGAPFETVAREKSTDTQSGQNGGALGCLRAGAFVPEFQTAAEQAPLGVVTGPVKTQFGFHVILATKAAATSYEAARAQIMQALQQEGSADLSAAVNDLFKRFKVRINKRFGTWGLVENAQGQKAYQVTAPKAPKPANAREGTTTTTVTVPVAPGGTP